MIDTINETIFKYWMVKTFVNSHKTENNMRDLEDKRAPTRDLDKICDHQLILRYVT